MRRKKQPPIVNSHEHGIVWFPHPDWHQHFLVHEASVELLTFVIGLKYEKTTDDRKNVQDTQQELCQQVYLLALFLSHNMTLLDVLTKTAPKTFVAFEAMFPAVDSRYLPRAKRPRIIHT